MAMKAVIHLKQNAAGHSGTETMAASSGNKPRGHIQPMTIETNYLLGREAITNISASDIISIPFEAKRLGAERGTG